MARNEIYQFYVEGEDEKKVIETLKKDMNSIVSGKVEVLNVIQKEIKTPRIRTLKTGTNVVLIYDTDIDKTDILDKNIVTGKPPVPLQTKNKRKRGTSCENSSFFVFRISTRPASLLARLFHLGNPLFAFFRKLLRPWKQVLQEIQIRIVHMIRNLGQQMRDVVEDIQIVEFAGLHNAVDDGTGFGSVDGVD